MEMLHLLLQKASLANCAKISLLACSFYGPASMTVVNSEIMGLVGGFVTTSTTFLEVGTARQN